MSKTADNLIREAQRLGRSQLDEAGAKALLAEVGLDVPKGVVLSAGDVDLPGLSDLTPPWALKILSPDIQHKSDGGFVGLGIGDTDALRTELDAMRQRALAGGFHIDGFLVEEMAAPGIELVVGCMTDPTFGPVVMLGLGGVFVEILGDVSFRICPIQPIDALDMIDELKGAALLDGARGRPSVDRETVVRLLLAVGGADGLMMQLGDQVSEIDINPVIANGSHAVAVDALIVLAPEAEA